MLIEDIKFPGIWINKGEECKVITTFKSAISREVIVAVREIKGMGHYDRIVDTIPFNLNAFINMFEPKLES